MCKSSKIQFCIFELKIKVSLYSCLKLFKVKPYFFLNAVSKTAHLQLNIILERNKNFTIFEISIIHYKKII